jgi:hypothetical protein
MNVNTVEVNKSICNVINKSDYWFRYSGYSRNVIGIPTGTNIIVICGSFDIGVKYFNSDEDSWLN